jgi:hypothetical protein
MGFEAKIVADSVAEHGARITTFELCYPRFIHSELMTHRVLSRNAMSSRAVPVAKMLEQVRNNPAWFVEWGKNQPGMQAKELLIGEELLNAQRTWMEAAMSAADFAEKLAAIGCHKQIANRVLEPFQWMRTIVTATEWDNFWELRCHRDAQPEFQKLAYMMRDAYTANKPVLRPRERYHEASWHLPYVTSDERAAEYACDPFFLAKLSTARCARVSFLNHDGTHPLQHKDVELFEKLIVSKPMHASPCEHQAYPAATRPSQSGNFMGWNQHRKWLEAEAAMKTWCAANSHR